MTPRKRRVRFALRQQGTLPGMARQDLAGLHIRDDRPIKPRRVQTLRHRARIALVRIPRIVEQAVERDVLFGVVVQYTHGG